MRLFLSSLERTTRNRIVYALPLVCAAVLFAGSAYAETPSDAPTLLITWRAKSYVPPDYQGKILPSVNTPIEVAAELIDGGKFVDSQSLEFQWFLDNVLEEKRVGKASHIFPPIPSATALERNVRVKILNYKNGSVERAIQIPLASPKLVLDAPVVNAAIPKGLVTWKALPYFFDVISPNALQFFWTANQESTAPGQSSDEITLDLSQAASGDDLFLRVAAQLKQKFQVANYTKRFVIQ